MLVIVFVATGAYRSFMYSGDSYGQQKWKEYIRTYEMIEIVFSVVSILLGIGAILDAFHYNIVLVALNAVWILGGYVAGIVIGITGCKGWNNMDDNYYDYQCTPLPLPSYFISFAIIVAILYPHIGFIIEVKKGILPLRD